MRTRTVILLPLLFTGALACEPTDDSSPDLAASDELDERVTNVPQSPVEDQTIGNCWIYATASMVESIHLAKTGVVRDVSQSYWTYLHWFDQITAYQGMSKDELTTGGDWPVAASLIRRYGLMEEPDFVEADTYSESAYIQSSALSAVNRALASGGALATDSDRRDREKVRRVLDQAWRLTPQTVGHLDQVFGADMARTFETGADATGTPIVPAAQLEVSYSYGPNSKPPTNSAAQTLLTAVNEWQQITSKPTARYTMQRIQRALHASNPVLISWYVDFNALEKTDPARRGAFTLAAWQRAFERNGVPGRQGGHMTVLEDYQAEVFANEETTPLEATVAKNELIVFEPIAIDENVTVKVVMQPAAGSASGEDADLFVRLGAAPTLSAYDCRPYKAGSSETCSLTGPGEIYVAVSGYTAASVDIQVTRPTTKQVLEAGVTLDPEVPQDQRLLDAALANEAKIVFLRVKNSWGTDSGALPFAPGPFDQNNQVEKGYHDLYMDYLQGPIANENTCSKDYCPRNVTPLMGFVVPPGY